MGVIAEPVSPAATTESPGSSRPSTPGSVGSVDEAAPVGQTSSKVKKYVEVFFLACLVAMGLTLLCIGTVGSFGSLPFILLAVATVVAFIAQVVVVRSILKKSESGPDVQECDDLCKFIDTGSRDCRKYDEFEGRSIHYQFGRDCVRDRHKEFIDGTSSAERFPEENAQYTALTEEYNRLLAHPDLSESEEILGQLEEVEGRVGVMRVEFRNKLLAHLVQVTDQALGEKTPLITPISAVMNQNVEILLNTEMQKISQKRYGGMLMNNGLESKIDQRHTLEFLRSGKVAARITVEAEGTFDKLNRKGEFVDLDPPCKYTGTMTIDIDHAGHARIETQISLN
jgi:hypothetical protein